MPDDAPKRDYLIGYLVDLMLGARRPPRSAKIDDNPDFEQRLAYFRDKMLLDDLSGARVPKAVTPEATRKLYDETVKTLPPETEVHARHILVDDRGRGQEGRRARVKGGEDFAKVAERALQGSGLRQRRRRSRLVHQGPHGAGIRRGRLQAAARPDLRAGEEPVRLARHQGRGASATKPLRPSTTSRISRAATSRRRRSRHRPGPARTRRKIERSSSAGRAAKPATPAPAAPAPATPAPARPKSSAISALRHSRAQRATQLAPGRSVDSARSGCSQARREASGLRAAKRAAMAKSRSACRRLRRNPSPSCPPIAGVRFATAEAGIRYKGRTDVLLAAVRRGHAGGRRVHPLEMPVRAGRLVPREACRAARRAR